MAELGKIFPRPVEDEVKVAYLNYAMSVITSRALPDVRDGLKPVHRRLLFAMDELGVHPNAPTKKSARITGDAMGKYHPHGDLSLYDALVRMAQTFSLRYPLVQGQGNFGSIDGDPPAASRYTEAKLSRFGEEMLTDLDKETVDFGPNYDESLKEPLVLPSALPNLLVNGSSGIAVGMATNMPPHNLNEVSDAIAAYIDNPDISTEDLMNFIKGPDFPTGGIIYGRQGIREAYLTGKGKIVVRGKFTIETTKTGREQIIFNEIPYGVNKSLLVKRIAELIREKTLDGVSDLRDESDRDGLRVVLDLKKGAITKVVLNKLFTHTPLQSTFGVINMVIVDGKPMCLGLKDLIKYFVLHRVDVVTRRCKFELRKCEEKAHILRGIVIALQNIDEVVAIIKGSKDSDLAKLKLMDRFGLDDVQAQAILDMKLSRLTSLETSKIEADLAETEARIAYLKDILSDEAKIRGVVKAETLDFAKRYGDARRTEIVANEVEQINLEDMIKPEEMIILISNKGFVKRVSSGAYRSQGRGGKGSNSADLMEDDYIEQLFVANTHDYLLFITTEGKAYWLKAHEIPEATRQARGAHIKGLLSITPNEEITAVVNFKDFSDTQYILMGTLRGVVKKVATSEFSNAKTRGIIAIKLDDGDRLVSACLTNGSDQVVLITRMGQALRIAEDTVRVMGRASHGVCGIRLDKEDELAAMLRVTKEERIMVLSEYGYGKRTDFDNFNSHGRATGGQMIYAPDEKTGELIGAIAVRDDDNVMVITSQGKTLKIDAGTVNIQGKGARGVRVVNIDRPDFVIALDRIAKEDDAEVLAKEDAAIDHSNDAMEIVPTDNGEEILPHDDSGEEDKSSEDSTMSDDSEDSEGGSDSGDKDE